MIKRIKSKKMKETLPLPSYSSWGRHVCGHFCCDRDFENILCKTFDLFVTNSAVLCYVMGDRKAKKSGLNRCAVPCLSKEGGPCNPMQSGSFEQSIIVGDSHNDKCLLSKMATHTTQTSFWNKSVEEKYGRVRCRQHPKNHNTPQRKILSTMSSSLSNIRLNEPKISETEMKQVTEMNAKTISYPDSTSADSAWSTLLLLPGAESLSACIASSQISASLLSIKRIDFLRTLSLVAFFL